MKDETLEEYLEKHNLMLVPKTNAEPVAWMSYEDLKEWKEGLIENAIVYENQWEGTFPLYTTPQDQLDRIAELEKLCKQLALANESLMKL